MLSMRLAYAYVLFTNRECMAASQMGIHDDTIFTTRRLTTGLET
jgi:hypothetical protein